MGQLMFISEEQLAQMVEKRVQQILNEREREKKEPYLSGSATARWLGVRRLDLIEWERAGVLVPKRVGSKARYALRDVKAFREYLNYKGQ